MDTDNELCFWALTNWANHIETGNVSMSAVDAVNQSRHSEINGLSLDQQRLVVRIRDLAIKAERGQLA